MPGRVLAAMLIVWIAFGVSARVSADFAEQGKLDTAVPGVFPLDGVSAASSIEFAFRTHTAARTSAVVSFRLYSETDVLIMQESWLSVRDQWIDRTLTQLSHLDEELRPAYFELESGAGLDYELSVSVTERPSYNDAGTSLESARRLELPAEVRGNLRGEEPGHFYVVELGPGASLQLDGAFTGDERTGSRYNIVILDSGQTVVIGGILAGAAYGQEERAASFTNDAGEARDFYLQVEATLEGATWELLDYVLVLASSDDDDDDGQLCPDCDLDDDGIPNDTDDDDDGDGLTDDEELHRYGTDPNDRDSDDGGVDDGTEVADGRDPNDPNDDAGFMAEGGGSSSCHIAWRSSRSPPWDWSRLALGIVLLGLGTRARRRRT